MARSRNIKPGFFANEELVELSFSTRLLFIGLWTIADRAGRLEDKPKRIKMGLFPADDINIDEALSDLQSHGFISRYSIDSMQYIQILAFDKHQNPHKDEKASTIPAEDKHCAATVQTPYNNDGNPADSFNLIPDSPIPEIGAKIAPNPKGKALPLDWKLPKSWSEWALSEKSELNSDDVIKMAEAFKDHWLSNANQANAKKADWEATWRNWVRRQYIQPIKTQTSNREQGRHIAAASIFKPEHTQHLQGNHLKTIEVDHEPTQITA